MVKSSIPFGRIKCHSKAWWSAEMEEAVSENARLSLQLTEATKIAKRTSPLLDAPRQSLPRPRLRHGRRLALLFYLHQIQKLYTLFFTLSLALFPGLPPLLTPKLFLSQGICFGLCRLPEIPLFRFSVKGPA